STWSRFKTHYHHNAELGLSLDISRIPFPDDFLARMEPAMQKAFADMAALEGGAIANPDENRMVGHYWLRNPALAPSTDPREAITGALDDLTTFDAKIRVGVIAPATGKKFTLLLVVGIGGFALGHQFVN